MTNKELKATLLEHTSHAAFLREAVKHLSKYAKTCDGNNDHERMLSACEFTLMHSPVVGFDVQKFYRKYDKDIQDFLLYTIGKNPTKHPAYDHKNDPLCLRCFNQLIVVNMFFEGLCGLVKHWISKK